MAFERLRFELENSICLISVKSFKMVQM